MKRWISIAIAFGIGLGFQLFLESLFPYSAIGFDPMGQYILELYSHPPLIHIVSSGIIYYLVSLGINDVVHDPLLTIKLLDSLISGLFIAALYYFTSKTIGDNFALPLALIAFFSYQFFAFSWGFEKEIIAFSIFLVIATIRNFNLRNFLITLPMIIISGLADPTIIPLEFIWFLLLAIKQHRFIFYDIFLFIVGGIQIYLFGVYGISGEAFALNIIASLYTPSNLFAIGFLAIIMLLPFVILLPDLVEWMKDKEKMMENPMFLLLMSLLFATLVAGYFAARYIMFASVFLFLLVPLKDVKKRGRSAVLVTITILVAASFLIMPVSDPSPVFGSHLNMESGEIDIVPGSFQQSTVPIEDAPTLVHLYSYINQHYSGNSSRIKVVTLLYTAAFAYESGIRARNIIDFYTNYGEMINTSANLVGEGYAVYAVWWVSGGWYGINSLSPGFKLIRAENGFGLYEFNSSASQ